MKLEIQTEGVSKVSHFVSELLSIDAISNGHVYAPTLFAVTATENTQLVAGLTGNINWNWMYIEKLAVDRAWRKRGLGSSLTEAAIQYAAEQHCRGIWVDTFTFQAPAFYTRLGFVEFGRIEQFPNGHARIFLRLDLTHPRF